MSIIFSIECSLLGYEFQFEFDFNIECMISYRRVSSTVDFFTFPTKKKRRQGPFPVLKQMNSLLWQRRLVWVFCLVSRPRPLAWRPFPVGRLFFVTRRLLAVLFFLLWVWYRVVRRVVLLVRFVSSYSAFACLASTSHTRTSLWRIWLAIRMFLRRPLKETFTERLKNGTLYKM